jgi:hypothetical protein
MNLTVNGKPRAIFNSKYSHLTNHPFGPPVRVPQPMGKPVLKASPEVIFDNHTYATGDQHIAKALIESEHFGDIDGWCLDQECLPEELRELYPRFPPATRRRIALSLVNGESVESVFDTIDLTELDQAAGPTGLNKYMDHVVRCPEPGCGLEMAATGPDGQQRAQAALVSHVNIMHRKG